MPNPPEISPTPDLGKLHEEFKRAGGIASQSVRREWNDRIRYCRWHGRTSDYKKHREALGRDPVPWEDAWDGRVYTADDVIEELGDMLSNAFRRAQFSVKPTSPSQLAKADSVKKVMEKYRDRHRAAWNDEADFIWQFGLTYGASVWQTSWQTQIALKEQSVSLEEIAAAAQQAAAALQSPQAGQLPPEQIGKLQFLVQLPQMVADASREEEVAKLVQTFAQQLAAQLYRQERQNYGEGFLENYQLSAAKARQVARQLRTEGKSSFPAPYLHRNGPDVVARQPGYDFFLPPETTDLDGAPWQAIREWLTPADVEAHRAADGWAEAWCERAIKTVGSSSAWGDGIDLADNSDNFATDDTTETYAYKQSNTKSNLVEVIHHFQRYTSPEGVPQIWCTIYCPHALKDEAGKDLYAKHYPLPRAEYDSIEYRWKKKKRNFHENMGIPEMIGSDQQQIKRTLDQLEDRKDIEINPAWQVANRLSLRYKAGPGAQIPRKRAGDIEPMPPPTGNPELGFQLLAHTEQRLAYKFGLLRPIVPPALSQLRLQAMAERYLGSAQAMFAAMLKLIQENADEAELARMGGGDPGFPSTAEEIEGEYELSLYFDVKDLDMEFVWKKLEAITKLAVPLDRAGVIDLSTLVKLIMLAIDPQYAQLLVQDKQGASQKTFNDMKSQIALMYLGNEPDYVENDPAAGMKLQFARQIIFGDAQGNGANPEYLEALGQMRGGDPSKVKPRFQELLQKFQDNLQMSLKQDQNKQIGRLGVQPEGQA